MLVHTKTALAMTSFMPFFLTVHVIGNSVAQEVPCRVPTVTWASGVVKTAECNTLPVSGFVNRAMHLPQL